jgi:hypothetical protein
MYFKFMGRVFLILSFVVVVSDAFSQSTVDAWNEFAKTKFDPKYDEKSQEYFMAPTFATTLKAMEGKEVTLQGFFVPFASEDGNYIIISKFPMSQCFFCGGGGPESIAEVYFMKPASKFKTDDVLKVRGKLKLNTNDIEHVNFILTQAVLIN